MGMPIRCRPGRKGPNVSRIAGIALMVAGALTLLLCLPDWVWAGTLAIVMISVGFLLWRFS